MKTAAVPYVETSNATGVSRILSRVTQFLQACENSLITSFAVPCRGLRMFCVSDISLNAKQRRWQVAVH